ncbi:MAG: hypothetical protein ABWX65_12890, partial [Mycetocola sp.]
IRDLTKKIKPTGIWHLTLCTLLSSQGSDAPAFHPSGLLRRATSLTYHSRSFCQIEDFSAPTESRRTKTIA